MTFDPFTATFGEAKAEPDALKPQGAIQRYVGAQILIARKDFFESNPLDGMAICARDGLVAPDWLAKAYLKGFRKVTGCLVGSWDEAFGKPYPKGVQVAALRRRRIARLRVANVVTDFVKQHPEISLKELWVAASATGSLAPDDPVGAAARQLGVGKTEAESLYAEAIEMGLAQAAAVIRASHGWPGKPGSKPAKSPKVAGRRQKR